MPPVSPSTAFATTSRNGVSSTTDLTFQFLRLPAVVQLTGLGRSTIYRLVAAREFPAPVRVARRAVAWRRADLDRWGETRQASSEIR
ncbi:MAG: AlpA family phage regulatory protein [Burkholderiaceae bacterium]|nr:AlpA family phage regulatory protein [Burkholderiaceae bacterium]